MKTVVLVGAGHAHLEVLYKIPQFDIQSNRFILISPSPQTYYSGLIPRFIAGEIQDSDVVIPSGDFARSRGIEFIQGAMTSFDPEKKSVALQNGQVIPFDILSINIGAQAKEIPTESPFSTIYLKPFDQFIEQWRVVLRTCISCTSPNFVVIGGGAASVEIATALRIRLNRAKAIQSQIHLVTMNDRLCKSYSEKTSAHILKALQQNNISVHFNEKVKSIGDKTLTLSDGKSLRFEAVFVAVSTIPSKESVDSFLRIHDHIFAAGDFLDSDYPRSGVSAVHQGRYLATAISNQLKGRPNKPFAPAKNQLNIMITGTTTATLVWGNFSLEGRLPRILKDWIDNNYMNKWKLKS